MALPTVQDLKNYLRIEINTEDALCVTLLARATAMLETWIDVPIVARSRTVIDRAEGLNPARSLIFPGRPIGSVTVVDGNGTLVTDYTVDAASGLIYATNGYRFVQGPYQLTAFCGLSLRSDYAILEPLISGMIIDLASDLYQRRTPGASNETGAGTSISWDASRETVARIMKSLRALRLVVAI